MSEGWVICYIFHTFYCWAPPSVLWPALWACLTSPFMPFGHSSHVTHIDDHIHYPALMSSLPPPLSTVRISISTLIFATFLCVFYLSFELLITIIKFFRYRWLPTERWLRTLSFEQRCSIIWLTFISFFWSYSKQIEMITCVNCLEEKYKRWSFGTHVSFQWEIMFFILFINKISNRFLYKYKYKINHVPQF